ncbi:hypothetical protein MPTK1_4g10330 [Marchantia polymorpha subsp. ruderalis]|uniref:Uncharacterized protein n=2 Tax=Marchantia polymorpha TaxID=3197 RepID=A0AAF6B8F1_MARPO|nr:hypothetical protein MARPO_0011s0020 [Marchantia polymorpha]BBN08285.1 hypothetical protein Mp_4g10330 [Marchantia polymorpha subsp. ruderalis]|eukprot:PTQ46321.1 hypothetical protein MARPO_0011s0020 [Marchantia polymorpha]
MKLRCDILEMQSGLSVLNIVQRWWRIFMSETHILYIIGGRPRAELSLSCTLWPSSSLVCSFELPALVVILSPVTVILSTTISSLRWFPPTSSSSSSRCACSVCSAPNCPSNCGIVSTSSPCIKCERGHELRNGATSALDCNLGVRLGTPVSALLGLAGMSLH